jgi:hypothetical protein
MPPKYREESALLKLPILDSLFAKNINWRAGFTPLTMKSIIPGGTDTVHEDGYVIL